MSSTMNLYCNSLQIRLVLEMEPQTQVVVDLRHIQDTQIDLKLSIAGWTWESPDGFNSQKLLNLTSLVQNTKQIR